MKNPVLIGGVIVVAVVAFVVYLVLPTAPTPLETVAQNTKTGETGKSVPKETNTNTKTTPSIPQTPSTPSAPIIKANGYYEDYSAEKVVFAKTGKVVLFFYSANCPACVILDKEIAANTRKVPPDVMILKVDMDANASVAQKYGVTAPHMMVQVDDGGVRITQWGGNATLSDLLTRVVKI